MQVQPQATASQQRCQQGPLLLLRLLHSQEQWCVKVRPLMGEELLAQVRTAVDAAAVSGSLSVALQQVVAQLAAGEGSGELQKSVCKLLGDLALSAEGEELMQHQGQEQQQQQQQPPPWTTAVSEACAAAAVQLVEDIQQCSSEDAANQVRLCIGNYAHYWDRTGKPVPAGQQCASNLCHLFSSGAALALAQSISMPAPRHKGAIRVVTDASCATADRMKALGRVAVSAVEALLSAASDDMLLPSTAAAAELAFCALLGCSEREAAISRLTEEVHDQHQQQPARRARMTLLLLLRLASAALLHGQEDSSGEVQMYISEPMMTRMQAALASAAASGRLSETVQEVMKQPMARGSSELGDVAQQRLFMILRGFLTAVEGKGQGQLQSYEQQQLSLGAAEAPEAETAPTRDWVSQVKAVCKQAAGLLASRVSASNTAAEYGSAESLVYAFCQVRSGAWCAPATELLHSEGVLAAVTAALQQHGEDKEVAARLWAILWNVSDSNDATRVHLRDLGLVPAAVEALQATPTSEAHAFLCNMCQCFAIHTSLKEAGTVGALRQALQHQPDQTYTIIAALAHLCAGVREDKEDEAAAAILAEHDITTDVAEIMSQAATTGRGRSFSLFEVAAAGASLSRTEANARRLAARGIPAMAVQALGNKFGRQPAACFQLCRLLLFMAEVEDLRPGIKQAGAVEALQALLTPSPGRPPLETKTQDAARGCLMLLGALEDQASTAAALQQHVAAEAAGISGTGTKHYVWDVFISHKRSDAKDFARSLYILLSTRGARVFLDFNWREELTELEAAVAGSRNLLFVLTDNVLDSGWCLKELQAAVANNINIILVTKDGARWTDQHGNPNQMFPPSHVVSKLPADIRGIFSGSYKSVAHSDEYYDAFSELLWYKVLQGTKASGASTQAAAATGAAAAAAAAATPAAGMPGMAQGLQLGAPAGTTGFVGMGASQPLGYLPAGMAPSTLVPGPEVAQQLAQLSGLVPLLQSFIAKGSEGGAGADSKASSVEVVHSLLQVQQHQASSQAALQAQIQSLGLTMQQQLQAQQAGMQAQVQAALVSHLSEINVGLQHQVQAEQAQRQALTAEFQHQFHIMGEALMGLRHTVAQLTDSMQSLQQIVTTSLRMRPAPGGAEQASGMVYTAASLSPSVPSLDGMVGSNQGPSERTAAPSRDQQVFHSAPIQGGVATSVPALGALGPGRLLPPVSQHQRATGSPVRGTGGPTRMQQGSPGPAGHLASVSGQGLNRRR